MVGLQGGVNLRDGFVHRALGVPKDDAAQSVDAAERVVPTLLTLWRTSSSLQRNDPATQAGVP